MTEAFNAMPVDVARGHLLTCLDVPRWADEVAAARPHEGLEGLEDRMTDIAARTSDEVERAETINQMTQIALLRFREVMS